MNKMKVVLSCLFSVAMFFTSDVLACSCEIPRPNDSVAEMTRKERKASSAVFLGEVLSVVKVSELENVAKIRVEVKWKGVKTSEVNVSTGIGGGDCGFLFEVGEKYLIYVSKSKNGAFTTNICSRTKPLSEAREEIKILQNK